MLWQGEEIWDVLSSEVPNQKLESDPWQGKAKKYEKNPEGGENEMWLPAYTLHACMECGFNQTDPCRVMHLPSECLRQRGDLLMLTETMRCNQFLEKL
jgi:hypothetical protein